MLSEFSKSAVEGLKSVFYVVLSGAITYMLSTLPPVKDSFDLQVALFYLVLFVLMGLRDLMKRNNSFGFGAKL